MFVNALRDMMGGGTIVNRATLGKPSYYRPPTSHSTIAKKYTTRGASIGVPSYALKQMQKAAIEEAAKTDQWFGAIPATYDPTRAQRISTGSQLGSINEKRMAANVIVDHSTDADDEKEYDPQKLLQYTSNRFYGTPGKLEGPTKGRSLSDSEMRKLHEMFCLWSTDGINAAKTLDNFNRFYALYPEMEMPQNLKSYIFITRPEMNIYSNITSRTLVRDNVNLVEMDKTCPEMLKMLSQDYSTMHDFMPYLQSRAVSMQLTDYEIASSEYGVPFYNYKYSYPTVTNNSQTGGTVDVTFREDAGLRLTKTFRFWIYYMDCINKGILTPTQVNINDYTYDYMCSIYQFICDPTSEWVLWYSKYTGCFPTSVPISNLSFSLGDSPDNKVSISFNYVRVEHMDPSILTDFAANVHATGTDYLDLHDGDFDIPAPSLSACPKLVRAGNKTLLKWLPMQDGPSTGIVMSNGQPFDPYRMGNVNNFAKQNNRTLVSHENEPYGEMYDQVEASATQQQILDRQFGALLNQETKLKAKKAPEEFEKSTLQSYLKYNSSVPSRR